MNTDPLWWVPYLVQVATCLLAVMAFALRYENRITRLETKLDERLPPHEKRI